MASVSYLARTRSPPRSLYQLARSPVPDSRARQGLGFLFPNPAAPFRPSVFFEKTLVFSQAVFCALLTRVASRMSYDVMRDRYARGVSESDDFKANKGITSRTKRGCSTEEKKEVKKQIKGRFPLQIGYFLPKKKGVKNHQKEGVIKQEILLYNMTYKADQIRFISAIFEDFIKQTKFDRNF